MPRKAYVQTERQIKREKCKIPGHPRLSASLEIPRRDINEVSVKYKGNGSTQSVEMIRKAVSIPPSLLSNSRSLNRCRSRLHCSSIQASAQSSIIVYQRSPWHRSVQERKRLWKSTAAHLNFTQHWWAWVLAVTVAVCPYHRICIFKSFTDSCLISLSFAPPFP